MGTLLARNLSPDRAPVPANRHQDKGETAVTYVFEPAVKAALKGRVALVGPSGSGKTWTSLVTASALAQGGKIAVIDTNRRQSLHYADLWNFDVAHMRTFHPDNLTAALGDCSGYDVAIVDTWSSFWAGTEGMLEQVDLASEGRAGSTFNNGWKTMRPVELRMMEAMMSFPGHLIVTIRTKTEWLVGNVDGKAKPVKVGTKPEQRENLEYEFDLVANMDMENTLSVVKSHCPPLHNLVTAKPTEEFGFTFLQWLNNGTKPKSAWDWRAEIMEEHDVDALRRMRDQLVSAGVGGTPMLDDYGNATTLIEIVNRRGRDLMATSTPAARGESQ